MTKTLEEAMTRVGALPLVTQERIGEELLLRVEKLEELRAKLDRGISSLEHFHPDWKSVPFLPI